MAAEPDKTIFEGTNETLTYDLTRGGVDFEIGERYFEYAIIGSDGRAVAVWNRESHPNRFTVAPEGDLNRIVVHPTRDVFKAALSEYKTFFLVKDGDETLAFPNDRYWTVAVLDNFGVSA